jgi:hypothetical protein
MSVLVAGITAECRAENNGGDRRKLIRHDEA